MLKQFRYHDLFCQNGHYCENVYLTGGGGGGGGVRDSIIFSGNHQRESALQDLRLLLVPGIPWRKLRGIIE